MSLHFLRNARRIFHIRNRLMAIFLMLFELILVFPLLAASSLSNDGETTSRIFLFFFSLFSNRILTSFLGGMIFASLIYIFMLVKQPAYVYSSLVASPAETFQQIAKRDENGTFLESFSRFARHMHFSRKTFFYSFLLLVIQLLAFFIFTLFVFDFSTQANAEKELSTQVRKAESRVITR